jgi:hypothetical protein
MILLSQNMFRVVRNRAVWFCALITVSDGPAVTVNASYLEKNGGKTVEVGSVGTMTSDKAGALVTVGGIANPSISAKIAGIDDSQVTLEVIHPDHESQQVVLNAGETKDVFFSDRSGGVRLRFTEAK